MIGTRLSHPQKTGCPPSRRDIGGPITGEKKVSKTNPCVRVRLHYTELLTPILTPDINSIMTPHNQIKFLYIVDILYKNNRNNIVMGVGVR